jgi:PAS domain S-box-containing protein
MGTGLIGGRLIDYEAIGTRAGEVGLRILAGENPQNIPPQTIPSTTMFDWRELQRWGIDESRLPAGSVLRFREPTFWDLYKWRVVGVISLIILQALLIIGLLINRARRRRAEEASRASEIRYRNVVETQTELICRFLPDTTLTFVNDAYCRHFGRTAEQLLGMKYTELIPEHARDAALSHIASLIANPRTETYEHEVVLPNGARGWHQWVDHVVQGSQGEGIELQGIGRDITQRRRAEENLRSSESRFRMMADSAPLLIWMCGPDGRCTYLNQGWLEFTGRTLEQELGTGWTDGIFSEDYRRCLDAFQAASDRREPFKIEYRLRRADAVFCWLYSSGTPRFSSDGEFLGYIGSCVDITDRKESEEALRLAHAEVSKLKNQLEAENIYLKEEIRLSHNVDEIVGDSDAIKYVLFKIEQVGQTDSTVLILGETGTGKELVARAIHNQSLRKDRPLVKVNCAALSASLIESELFGHEKGSFTGASARKIGRFELADGGTIFLDEIGELPLELQSKLLRIVQEGEFERLGGTKTIKIDVRILAATNRNLKAEVEKGTFREDLWYRLNVFPITVPPLRQRREDVPQLVEHFVNALSKKVGKNITAISATTLKKLQSYSWPGNVRELANVIERAVINAQGPVLHIADQFEAAPEELSTSTRTLEEVEKEYIIRILDESSWRIEGPNGAAKRLGLNPSTLRTRMVKLGIQKSVRAIAGNPVASN